MSVTVIHKAKQQRGMAYEMLSLVKTDPLRFEVKLHVFFFIANMFLVFFIDFRSRKG